MMKIFIAGFILLLAGIALIHMYSGATEAMVTRAHQAQVAQADRPENLKHLKRPALPEACTKNPDWDINTCQTMDEKEVQIGMTGEQVLLAWGKPARVNTTSFANHHRLCSANSSGAV
jgi:hypothetical protein